MKGEVRQDMFKRFLAAALSALLFLQALPLEALADGIIASINGEE